MTEDGDDPLLAHWQCELGKTVAFTSGYWPVWGEAWTRWPQFAKFWAQMVRWTMRQDTPANFDTHTRVEGNRARITVDALDKDASFLNNLQLKTNVLGPDGQSAPVIFTQTGPGHYEADFDVERAGQYLANVQILDQGKLLGTLRTGVSAPFSPEYRDLAANEPLLRQVADITGGRWLDKPAREANVFSHDLPPSEARRSAWEWVLAWLLLPAFLLDVSVRRLASWLAWSIVVEVLLLVVLLFGFGIRYSPWWGILGAFLFAELVGWTIRFRYIGPMLDWLTHTAAALAQTGERSTVALDKLKGVRDRAREELTSQPEELVRPVEQPLTSRDVAKRRFDAKEQKTKPSGDLAESLGGAKPTDSVTPAQRPPQAPQGEAESPTSRLLRAKKRAKKDTDDNT